MCLLHINEVTFVHQKLLLNPSVAPGKLPDSWQYIAIWPIIYVWLIQKALEIQIIFGGPEKGRFSGSNQNKECLLVELLLFGGFFGEEGGMDMREDASLCDGDGV